MGDATFGDDAILATDEWLSAVEKDRRRIPLSKKLIAHRPSDRCTNGVGVEIPPEMCDAAVESYTAPRIEAGMPFTDDIMKCALRPLRASEYYPIQFNDAQWKRLRAVFPNGVCDYSKRGISQRPTVPWLTYQDDAGRVVYGGKPMGARPRSVSLGPR
jgi:hypothetical protein